MWIYETKTFPPGVYKEDTLIKLLITIAKHRFHHLKNDGRWMD